MLSFGCAALLSATGSGREQRKQVPARRHRRCDCRGSNEGNTGRENEEVFEDGSATTHARDAALMRAALLALLLRNLRLQRRDLRFKRRR
jgi:hypothetical protein